MKRILFLLCLAAGILGRSSAKAQDITVTGIKPESFSGVRLSSNGERYYLVFMDATAQDSANMILKVYDRGLQPKADVSVPVAKGTQVAASVFTGQFYVVQLVNPGNKTRSTVFLDEGGNIIRRKDETDIKASALAAASYPTFFPVSMNEYLAFRTNRDGKPAYEVALMDAETNARWTKTLDATDIVEFKTEMDRVYLLRKERIDSKDVYSIQSFSGMAGDVFFTTEMRQGDNIGIPGFLNVQQGFITTGGVFRKETGGDRPEGLFYARLSPTGTPEQIHFIPWGIIKARLKNNMIADLESGKTGILIKNAIPDANGDGVTLVGEAYKKIASAEPNTANFSTQDFVLVHMTKMGEVDRVTQVPKQENELLVKGSMSAKSGLEMAQWLDKNNFFSYRAVLPIVGKNVIAWLDNRAGKATASFATMDSTGTVAKGSIVTVNLDGQTAEKEKGREGEKNNSTLAVLNSTEKDLYDFTAARLEKNLMPVQEGHILIYNYAAPDLRFWIMPVESR